MRQRSIAHAALASALLLAGTAFAQTTPPATGPATTPATRPAMELILPARGGSGVPANNDYDNPESDFSHKRSKQTDHFALFWHKEYGDNPLANTGNRRFDVDEILKESERFYDYYVNTLKWVDKEKSFAVRYKMLIYIIGGGGGTAYGGSIENRIGRFWSPASRVARGPYGVVAHELGHSFQALVRADGAGRFSGPNVGEMTSQYMLWQVYPEWTTFENYHLRDFMNGTHLAFMHPTNQYHSCFPMEYWSNKHGVELMGKMWREVQPGEDMVMTYKRLTKVDQKTFNDEMFDACRRFVTWDMKRIEETSVRYANQHTTIINRAAAPAAEGWFQIDNSKVPQNYGYNAVKLKVPAAANTKVAIDFKGIAGAPGFSSMQVDKAGWRYGFLAHKEDNSRVYSDVFSKSEGAGEFTVPATTKFLWLVVMGAPTEHFIFSQGGGGRGGAGGRGGRGTTTGPATGPATRGAIAQATVIDPTPGTPATTAPGAAARGARGGGRGAGGAAAPVTNEQWPYQFKLTGTSPDDGFIR